MKLQFIGYGYRAKGSGALVLCDERFKDLPHVFPIYRHEVALKPEAKPS